MRLFYFREISFQNGRPLRVEKFRFFDVGLGEKLGNFLHRQEQTQGCLLEWLKVKMTIEAFDSLVLGVDNHGHGRNLLGGFQAATQRDSTRRNSPTPWPPIERSTANLTSQVTGSCP